jgi:serine/threonine protein kinase
MQRHSFTALNSTFVVDAEYQFVKELGQGAYGCVVAAKHRRTGEGCAIKKITNINTKVRAYFMRVCTLRVLGPRVLVAGAKGAEGPSKSLWSKGAKWPQAAVIGKRAADDHYPFFLFCLSLLRS